jgi:DNA-binding SARP family transcriptional activator
VRRTAVGRARTLHEGMAAMLMATGADVARVKARFLGPFSLEIDGQPVSRWRAGKARALFQYLLVNRGQVVCRDKLYDVLWPANDSRQSSSLKVAAHAVRWILTAHADAPGLAMKLIHRDHGYLLWAEDAWLDIEELHRAFDQGRTASLAKDHATAVTWFRRAASLYTGDFLAGESGDWVEEQRQCARAVALHALTELRTDALTCEDWPEVFRCCRRILDLEPYHEETYQTLMLTHAELGEPSRVKDWYELCRRRLRDDLSIEPAERTRRILESALNRRRDSPAKGTADDAHLPWCK